MPVEFIFPNSPAAGVTLIGLAITIILFVLWLVGFSVSWGTWVWFLLVLAAITLVINLVLSAGGRRSGL